MRQPVGETRRGNEGGSTTWNHTDLTRHEEYRSAHEAESSVPAELSCLSWTTQTIRRDQSGRQQPVDVPNTSGGVFPSPSQHVVPQ